MHPTLKKANFTYLLVGLLVVLLIDPIVQDVFGYSSRLLTSLAFSSVMIIGVWSLHRSRRLFRFGLVLISLSLSASVLGALFPKWPMEIPHLLVVAVFCGTSFRFIFADITSDLKVDLNRVVGAICLYLLLGLIFGITYTILETLLPGSFTNLPQPSEAVSRSLFYFSYVTLTTMGYGDIVPLRPMARTIAYLEAIVGVFYMAILVGSMIGLLLNRANAKIVENRSGEAIDK